MAQDFTVINVTPEQIVTRMVAFEPGPLPVADPQYVERMGGTPSSPDKVRATMPEWLSETVIPIPMIEEFKEELKQKGMLYEVCPTREWFFRGGPSSHRMGNLSHWSSATAHTMWRSSDAASRAGSCLSDTMGPGNHHRQRGRRQRWQTRTRVDEVARRPRPRA